MLSNSKLTKNQSHFASVSRPGTSRLGMETVAALVGTAFAAIMLVLKAMYAGPLWRDEVNTANLAQMPSLAELWKNMSFESFPPLWPLLLRGCDLIGLTGSDAGIRVLGLYVGLFFLASIWACARWIGSRAPIMSIALLGSLPAFIFILGSNRAYGSACCLLVLSLGTIWRVLESPTRTRVFWAGLTCLLFAQCVYYDVIFLAAMLAGGGLVAIRRGQWKTLGALLGIGAVAAASLAIYFPIIHRGSAYGRMVRIPFFEPSMLWYELSEALTAKSSAQLGPRGPEIWIWIILMSVGFLAALALRREGNRQAREQASIEVVLPVARADLALFCLVSMFFGVAAYLVFLVYLHFWTPSWYYVEMLCLCAVSLDGLLGASRPALRPWGLLRIGFMVLMLSWGLRSAWEEAHTRRSNVDLIAAALNKNTSAGDLIIVQDSWEGITFNRYYLGAARWVTVPPIGSHLVHRTDLVLEKMNQELDRQDPMAPVLSAITNTLHGGNAVWLVGNKSGLPTQPTRSSGMPLEWFGTYLSYWNGQVSDQLLRHALKEEDFEISGDEPVCVLENLPLTRFSGYKTGVDGSTANKK